MNHRWTAAGVGLALGGAILLAGRAPFWWLGAALLAAAGVILCPMLRRWWADQAEQRLEIFRHKAAMELICLALLVVVAVMAVPEVAGGDRPISKDHTAHYLRAWKTRFDLLPYGQLHGWTHGLFAGYPTGYNYPIGSDLWISSVHLASMGTLDFSESYAVGFFLSFLLLGFAVYRLGKRFFGRATGLLAGLLYLTDPGIIGLGWDAFQWGVWPQRLAMAFALLALSGLPEVVRSRRLAPAAVFGLLMGAALVTHPVVLLLQLAALATALVLWLRWGGAGPQGEPAGSGSGGRALLRLLLANGLGLMVAAFWLLPFIDTRHYADVIGRAGLPMLELGLGLLNLELFEGTWGLVLVLAVAGLVRAIRRGTVEGRFTAWLSLLLFFGGSGQLLLVLNLPDHVSATRSIQFERVSLLAKPFLFLLAAQTALWLVRLLRDRGKQASPPTVRRAVAVGLLTLMCLPMLASFGASYYSRHVGRGVELLSRRADQDERIQLVEFVNAQPSTGPLERVAFIGTPNDHSILDMATRLSRPFYKSGYTPGINFKFLIHSDQPSALQALKVRWIVAREELTEDEYRLVKRFGRYHLYQHAEFTPAPFQVLDGSGQVEVARFAAEEIVLKAGPGSNGILQLPVSYFPRWRLYKDGLPADILVKKLKASPYSSSFMSATLSPGTYRFLFISSTLDRVANWITVAGLALAILLLIGDLRRGQAALPVRLLERLVPAARAVVRWRGTVPAAAVVAATLLVAVLAIGTRPPKIGHVRGPKIDQVKYDFLNQLASATVWRNDDGLPPRQCPWRVDRFSCGDSLKMVLRSRYTSHFSRCVEADMQTAPGFTATFRDVPAGDGIFGYFMCYRGEGKITLLINGELGPSVNCKKHSKQETFVTWFPPHMKGKEHTVSFVITQHGEKMGRFCFLAQSINRAAPGNTAEEQ